MEAPGLLFVTLLLASGLVALASQGLGLAYPYLRGPLHRVAPERRARLLSGLAASPWLLALGTLVLTFMPSFIGIPGLMQDHCLPHDHHPHLCLSHGSWAHSNHAWMWLALMGMASLIFGVKFLHRLRAAHQRVQTLLRLAKEKSGVHQFPNPQPLAFSAGLFRPRTLLSSGAVAALHPSDLQVVLAHEQAHANRRDQLRRVVAEAMLMAVPHPFRSMLLADLSLACEEACDRAALPVAGSAENMAEVLLRVQRLSMAVPDGLPGASGSHLSLRIRALLAPCAPSPATWSRWLWCAPLLLLLADPVHHAAETLLGLVNP